MPGYNDRERKIALIQYAQTTRKQVIKVFAMSKWARVADEVQKAVVSATLRLGRSAMPLTKLVERT